MNSRLKIYRTISENEIVKDKEEEDTEDVVATIIFSISKHFRGNPSKIKDKIAYLLTNLKCLKLQDLRCVDLVF